MLTSKSNSWQINYNRNQQVEIASAHNPQKMRSARKARIGAIENSQDNKTASKQLKHLISEKSNIQRVQLKNYTAQSICAINK